jgi:hypothetical protein
MTPFVLFGLAGVGADWSCLVAMSSPVAATAELEKSLDLLDVSCRFEGEAVYWRLVLEVGVEMSSSLLAWHTTAALSDGLFCPFVECIWFVAQSSFEELQANSYSTAAIGA